MLLSIGGSAELWKASRRRYSDMVETFIDDKLTILHVIQVKSMKKVVEYSNLALNPSACLKSLGTQYAILSQNLHACVADPDSKSYL